MRLGSAVARGGSSASRGKRSVFPKRQPEMQISSKVSSHFTSAQALSSITLDFLVRGMTAVPIYKKTVLVRYHWIKG
ncbi:hypothetical protein CUC15_18605 [Oceanobacillus zhaokaii]|uniref:Uncharacterized protein n=1 Tax=Oceanobacillus zhaokaii TaxID=2052660 RepID=A0A345PLF2_9BACI|nr:hypothetical protein CUC15_18605 [Oceanobacillus zhaokaii]